MTAPFAPRFEHPVSFPSLRTLEPAILTAALGELANSISHLERSNDELKEFCAPSSEESLDPITLHEFTASIQENETTIARQRERVQMMRIVLEEKIGVDAANSHYSIAPLPSRVPAPVEESTRMDLEHESILSNGSLAEMTLPNGTSEDEGMYL